MDNLFVFNSSKENNDSDVSNLNSINECISFAISGLLHNSSGGTTPSTHFTYYIVKGKLGFML